MKVALLTNTTADASLPVFKHLHESSDVELAHTYFYDTIAESRKNIFNVIATFGVRQVITKATGLLIDKISGLFGSSSEPKTTYEYVKAKGLPHTVLSDINDPIHLENISKLNTLVVCNCKNILKKRLLTTEGVRFINIHSSLLPNYRGPCPIFWAMYHGESEIGITIHEISPAIDKGKILAQRAVDLDYSKGITELAIDLYAISADMLDDVLFERTSPDFSPAAGKGSYQTFPTSAERSEMKRRVSQRKSIQDQQLASAQENV